MMEATQKPILTATQTEEKLKILFQFAKHVAKGYPIKSWLKSNLNHPVTSLYITLAKARQIFLGQDCYGDAFCACRKTLLGLKGCKGKHCLVNNLRTSGKQSYLGEGRFDKGSRARVEGRLRDNRAIHKFGVKEGQLNRDRASNSTKLAKSWMALFTKKHLRQAGVKLWATISVKRAPAANWRAATGLLKSWVPIFTHKKCLRQAG